MAISFPLYYNIEKQKKGLEDLAKENGRSANAQKLYLIDRAVLFDQQKKERLKLLKPEKPNHKKVQGGFN